MTRIHILSGTDRPNSTTERFSAMLKERYERAGAEVELISLREYPLADVLGGRYGEDIPSVTAFNRRILTADGLVMVMPEYNGSFPGILKLFIDYLPFPKAFEKFPIAFNGVASGAFGALRAVEQMQMICNYRNAFLFPERVFLQRSSANFDATGVKDAFTIKLLDSQVPNFIAFVEAMKPMRPKYDW
jgi:NAD(P)H-dependent FMN reductase